MLSAAPGLESGQNNGRPQTLTSFSHSKVALFLCFFHARFSHLEGENTAAGLTLITFSISVFSD
jgi:hypothetical protein